MYLLDTNVISEARKARSGAADRRVVRWLERATAGSLFVSVVSLLELELGVLRIERRDSAQGARLRRWLEEQVVATFSDRIISVDVLVARQTARLHVPDPQPERDALIAATAIVHGMTVVSRNVGDFEPTGVSLINPWETVTD
ncbi:MAG: type II toxin-antitoxin system VapC family toxin [Salinisphaera sp.]|jgi:predicted nucleic acid-binding protein|nr:type II toxin-antitoxin system VapC family toxin [Salinisphaera sp.]